MEQPETEKRKSPKYDSLDLDARARVTFVATAEDTEESEDSSRNDLSNEGVKEYLLIFFIIIIILNVLIIGY